MKKTSFIPCRLLLTIIMGGCSFNRLKNDGVSELLNQVLSHEQ